MVNLKRITLGSLLLLVAINAFAGGYYNLAGAKDVPLKWIEGSPFKNYFIPGLFLFVVIGGIALAASILVFSGKGYAYLLTLLCSVILMIWLGVQVSIIGYVSWMQPVTFLVAILIMILNHKPKIS